MLDCANFYVGDFNTMSAAPTATIASKRLACLSAVGVNLLEQRLIWYMARIEVPTFQIQEAFAHLLEETDLCHEWCEVLCESGYSIAEAVTLFDGFIRKQSEGGRNLQDDLRDSQRRAAVRRACRSEAELLAIRNSSA